MAGSTRCCRSGGYWTDGVANGKAESPGPKAERAKAEGDTKEAESTRTQAKVTPISWRGAHRMIPSRYPTVGLFDRVASPEDLMALYELESWTNDRISVELGVLHTIPREEWVTGPMASVVMAAFCHPRLGGGRFNSGARGAWYAARRLETSIGESVYHRTRELEEVGGFETRVQMRLLRANFRAEFHDVRAREDRFAPLHHPVSYEASQAFGARLLEDGSNGIVYRSVRHEGGECLCCFRPRLVLNARVAGHYEFIWEGTRQPRVRNVNHLYSS